MEDRASHPVYDRGSSDLCPHFANRGRGTGRSTSTGRSSTCGCRSGVTWPLPGRSSPARCRPAVSRSRSPPTGAHAYPRVLDEVVPAALHITEQYANNRVEADHGRLKARLRPMRGLKTLSDQPRVLASGHAFVQNLRRGHYDIATDAPEATRLREAFDELVHAI